jgi:hypothetical protein
VAILALVKNTKMTRKLLLLICALIILLSFAPAPVKADIEPVCISQHCTFLPVVVVCRLDIFGAKNACMDW